MSFLNPLALWSLLTLIPLIALYFLKVKPDLKPTTTLFLWDLIYKEKKQSGLFKNLRDLMSLIMIILAFTAISLAMARPVLTPKDSKRDLVLLIDNSASMATKALTSSRLEEAQTIAQNIVKSLTSSQNVVIASVSDALKIETNATNNQRALLEGIKNIKQTQLPLKSQELIAVAENKGIMPDSRFILISDGCFQGVEKLQNLELIKIGKQAENIGITSFDLRQIPSTNNTIGLFYQIISTYQSTQEVDLMLAQGNPENIVKIIPATVQPGENKPQILTFSDNRSGKWFLTVMQEDSFELDNKAYAQLNPPSPLRINLDVPENQPFFRQCIESFRSAGRLMKIDNQNPEISISHRGQSNGLNKIIFNPKGESPFWTGDMSEIELSAPKILIPEHPAIRFSSLDTLTFVGARQIKAPENSIILVEGEDKTPLLYKTTVDGVTAFIVNMDPMKSQLYFNIYFPIIIYSLSYDLAGKEANKSANYPTGAFLKANQQNSVSGPSGIIPVLNNSFKVEQSGFFEKSSGNTKETFAASLSNKYESKVSNISLKSTAKPIEASFPATDFLLILALILVSGECMLYHRRKVG